VKQRLNHRSKPAFEQLEERCVPTNIVEFRVPGGFGAPVSITTGPDGNLWFTQQTSSLDTATSDHVGQITTAGSVTEFPVPISGIEGGGAGLQIARGADGNLWYTELGKPVVARLTTAGVVTEFTVPTDPNNIFTVPAVNGITAGPDGNIWFTESAPQGGADEVAPRGNFPGISMIAKITPSGTITQYAVPGANESPMGITLGPDNNLWFTLPDANKIGRITVNGDVQEFQVPLFPPGPAIVHIVSGLGAITAGPDGNLWFVEDSSNRIGRITPQGAITEFAIPTAGSSPAGITGAPDGNVWFTEQSGNNVGRIAPDGTITEFAIPTARAYPAGITVGPNGNLWFTEGFGDNFVHPCGDSQIGEVILNLPPTPNGRFVNSLYVNLLGRPADLGGLAAWTASLDAGMSRAQVVLGFETSAEYRTDLVEQAFNHFLHRNADPQGLATSLAFLNSGGTQLGLEAIIVGSAEYFQLRGVSTNDGFLTALYQDTLNRAVDPSGRSSFDQALANGISRTRAAGILLTSMEYDQDLVSAVYQHLLNRIPDPGGLSAWVNALQAGLSQEGFTFGLVTSDEYLAISST
jgi:streptogramin lyase